jgi:predicted cobalt transporter CbtA
MLDRLGQAERICGISALLALISTYLPWYHFRDAHGMVTVNGFGAGFLGDVLFFSSVAMLLVIGVRAGLLSIHQLRLDDRHVLWVAGVALAAVVLQLLIGVNGSGAFHSITVGVIIALFSAGGMVVGARLEGQTGPGTHSLRRNSR